MKTAVVIPARYASSRYPGKPLIPLLGKPMIIWVAELCAEAVGSENVFIATEDKRIADVVHDFDFSSIMTSKDALTGTDRLSEASKQIDADIFINVQGDEPLVDPTDIIKIRDAKIKNFDMIVNGFCWVSSDEDPENINIPKVITNERDELIYMSRAPLPAFKDEKDAPSNYKKQVCIYAFNANELNSFMMFGRKSTLEHSEDIEILRFLELNKKILMVETKPGSAAIDVPSDVDPVEAKLKERHQL